MLKDVFKEEYFYGRINATEDTERTTMKKNNKERSEIYLQNKTFAIPHFVCIKFPHFVLLSEKFIFREARERN
jgi:hypothetical protein